MNKTNFVSRNGWFSLLLPVGWEEYDDGEGSDCYAFFNAAAKSWSGNLRITCLRCDASENKAKQYIQEELAVEGSQKIKLGSLECAHYKEESFQDGDEQVIYYWTTGIKNDLYLCSFVIDKTQENTSLNLIELDSVRRIIASIKSI